MSNIPLFERLSQIQDSAHQDTHNVSQKRKKKVDQLDPEHVESLAENQDQDIDTPTKRPKNAPIIMKSNKPVSR